MTSSWKIFLCNIKLREYFSTYSNNHQTFINNDKHTKPQIPHTRIHQMDAIIICILEVPGTTWTNLYLTTSSPGKNEKLQNLSRQT